MQAIHTRYLPATNVKGSRIKAESAAGSITIGYPHESNEPHVTAALALMDKLQWHGRFGIISGTLKDGSGVHVLVLKQG